MAHDSPIVITKDFQLLLCCASPKPDYRRIRAIAAAISNWQPILELSEGHGVLPMLRQGLKSACWDIVPQTIKKELDRLASESIRKNLRFTGELFRLIDKLQANRIPVVVFKGPVLSQTLYGNLSIRQFADLDILVKKVDLRRAEDMLICDGYAPQFADRAFRHAFLYYQKQYAFLNEATGNCVDLHWQFSRRGLTFPVHASEVWGRLRAVKVANRTVQTLSEEDLILFLAAHGTKEGWQRLIWIADFARLLQNHQDFDWSALVDRARQSRCSRSLLLAINLAFTLLNAPVPSNLVDIACTNSAVNSLSKKAQFRLVTATPQSELSDFATSLHAHDHLWQRLRAIFTVITTRTVGDHKAMPLPRSLWAIYYLTRPFRLAAKTFGRLSKNTQP